MSQSSTFVSHKATLAIDGDLRTTDHYCSHTDVNKTFAWFQVDLGKPYSISNVTLYYRKDGKANQFVIKCIAVLFYFNAD